MNIPLKVLIIEDSEIDAKLLVAMLRRGGFEPEFERVGDAAGLSAALDRWKWDVVLSDHLLPGIDSIEALGMVRAIDPDVPFIIVSGVIGDDLAVAAMKAGAQDYLMKTNLSRLAVAVARELQDAEDRRARQAAERALMAQEEELQLLEQAHLLQRLQARLLSLVSQHIFFPILLVQLYPLLSF